jgi:hypothetical protein
MYLNRKALQSVPLPSYLNRGQRTGGEVRRRHGESLGGVDRGAEAHIVQAAHQAARRTPG